VAAGGGGVMAAGGLAAGWRLAAAKIGELYRGEKRRLQSISGGGENVGGVSWQLAAAGQPGGGGVSAILISPVIIMASY